MKVYWSEPMADSQLELNADANPVFITANDNGAIGGGFRDPDLFIMVVVYKVVDGGSPHYSSYT